MNKKKLAIVCAYPATRNTGMITVDLALHRVLKDVAKDVDCKFYTYGDLKHLKQENLGVPTDYHHIFESKEEFLASDAFLFWGDYLHARSYQLDLKLRGASNEEIEKWLDLSFLADVEEARLNKAVVFGSTIITNEAKDEVNQYYGTLYERFFSNCQAVLFRDALSAAKISKLRRDEASFGCDCALLLRDTDLKQIEGVKLQTEKKGIGFYLGRSPRKPQACLFVRYLSYKMGKKVTWINWLPSSKKMRYLGKLFGFKVAKQPPTPGEILSQLSGYELIVSDTYHLCINAWRMGIPAICIGEGAGHLETTLNDKKKEILFEMYGARRFYVFTEHLQNLIHFPVVAKNIMAAVSDKELINQIHKNLDDNIKMAEKRLNNALKNILK